MIKVRSFIYKMIKFFGVVNPQLLITFLSYAIFRTLHRDYRKQDIVFQFFI